MEKESNTMKVLLAFLSDNENCLVCYKLEDLERITNIRTGHLLKILSRLANDNIIERHWIRVNGKKKRIYCYDRKRLEKLNVIRTP